MNIPDEVIEQAARIAWADEPGATFAEYDQLNPVGRAELMDTARKSAQVVAEWARREALKTAEDSVSELLADPAIFSTAAVTGVIRSLAAIRALVEGGSDGPLNA